MPERKIKIQSGKKEVWLEVTEEEYQRYYRPWWQQKKREQRNREAMEANGYTEESFENWRDNMGVPDFEAADMDEILEKKILLGVLEEALDSLVPEERELALHVWGGEMSLADFAKAKGRNPRTMSDNKRKVLDKLRECAW